MPLLKRSVWCPQTKIGPPIEINSNEKDNKRKEVERDIK